MKVLIVKPEKRPYEADIDGSLESMQAIVGGYIEAVYPFDDPVALVCNEEAKIQLLPPNRALISKEDGELCDIIAGNFFLAGLGKNDFTDLPQHLMEKYKERFWNPQLFLPIGDRVMIIDQDPVEEECKEDELKTEDMEPEM